MANRSAAKCEVINDLTKAQKESVLSLLNEGRREIRVSRDRFNLEVKREYLHRLMAGHLSIFRTILEDSRAAKLEGFGGVSRGLGAELDPRIESLLRVVNSLRSVTVEQPTVLLKHESKLNRISHQPNWQRPYTRNLVFVLR